MYTTLRWSKAAMASLRTTVGRGFCLRKSSTISTKDTLSFNIFRDVASLRVYRRDLLLSGREVGFVPTMGALHDGHLSLIRQAAMENSDIFVSIYVNPTQFGVNEDLSSYPRTWDTDLQMIKELQRELIDKRQGLISAVFAPTTKTMYPTLPPDSGLPGKGSFITITPLGSVLEGASRPVFFRGVSTVCAKLFNIVQPERVYFGQKDVQQTVIIRRLVKDFHFNTIVRIGSTQREMDGLAMSSRNVYLGKRRRALAPVLYRALKAAMQQWSEGKLRRDEILAAADEVIQTAIQDQELLAQRERATFEVDYISLADPDTLEEVEVVENARGAILSGAIRMHPVEDPQKGEDCGLGGGQGVVRLIDNIILPVRV